jgi:hypothetical protein
VLEVDCFSDLAYSDRDKLTLLSVSNMQALDGICDAQICTRVHPDAHALLPQCEYGSITHCSRDDPVKS